MTSPNDVATAIPGAPLVTAEPDSELEQLVTEYDRLDVEVKAKTEQLNTLKTRIKAELSERKPGETEVLLTARGLASPLRMYWQEKWTLDSKALKAKAPEIWVRWAKQSGTWYLGRQK